MTISLSPACGILYQAFSNGGLPLNVGYMYTYIAGGTTPQATYTTSAGNVANANPIVCDSSGRFPAEVWLTDGVAYRFDLYDSLGSLIKTYDNVYGIQQPVAGSGGSALVGFIQAGTNPYANTVQDKLRQAVSITDFKNDDGSRVTGDWNGSTGTNNKTGIQRAYNTGKSVIWPESADGRRYYVGTATTGNFLTKTRIGQWTFGQDGVSVAGLGTNGVTNSAAIICADSLGDNYILGLRFESNGTVLSTTTRDSPYAFLVKCTTATVNDVGMIGCSSYLCQALFIASKVVFSNVFEVNGINLDSFAEDTFYGAVFSNTGNNVKGKIVAKNAHRAYFAYGCSTHDIQVYDYHTTNLTALSMSIIGVANDTDTVDICTKSTEGLKVKYRTLGSTYTGGARLYLVTNYTTAQLTLNPAPNNLKIVNIEVDYQDAGSTSTSSIGWQYTLDGTNRDTFTGNLWDGIFLKGTAQYGFDITNQGAHAVIMQTVRGFADMTDLNASIAGASDDPFLCLFYGIPPHGYTPYAATPVAYGSTTAGTATAVTTNLQYRHGNKRVTGTYEYAWTGLVGAAVGNLRLGTGTLGTQFPATTLSNYKAMFPVASTTLTYAGQLWAQITAGTAYFALFESSSGGTLTAVGVQTAGTVIFSFDYATDN